MSYMFLLSHVIIAITSLVISGYGFFSPSWKKLHLAYAFIFLTILTGTILIFQKATHMTQICLTGLTYLGVVTISTVFTRRKLVKETIY